MLAGRQMADEIDVIGPRKLVRILRTSDEEPLRRPLGCRSNEQSLEGDLTIGGIGAEIGKIGLIVRERDDRTMDVGVDVAIERCDPVSAQSMAELQQGLAAGI